MEPSTEEGCVEAVTPWGDGVARHVWSMVACPARLADGHERMSTPVRAAHEDLDFARPREMKTKDDTNEIKE